MMFCGITKIFQDFVAPLYLFLKVDYELIMKQAGDILSSGDIEMNASVSKKITGNEIKKYQFDLKINNDSIFEIDVVFKEAKIKIVCQNELD